MYTLEIQSNEKSASKLPAYPFIIEIIGVGTIWLISKPNISERKHCVLTCIDGDSFNKGTTVYNDSYTEEQILEYINKGSWKPIKSKIILEY